MDTLLGAYALDALAGDERRRVEAHLEACDRCADESARLVAAAGDLGFARPMAPSPRVREVLLARARGEGYG